MVIEQCPACTEDGRPLSLVVEGQYRLYRCRRCRTQFFRQDVAAAGNEQSEYWEAHKFAFYNDPATRAAFAARYDRMVDVAERHIGPVRTVLDVGCGTGNFLAYAHGRGLEAVGVDPDRHAVAEARERGLEARLVDEIDKDDLPEHFDVLTMWDVIEHIIDPLAALKALVPRIRPGGALLFETPDGGFPLRRAVLAVHRLTGGRADWTMPLYYWEHKIYFTQQGFRALMQPARLRGRRRPTRDQCPREDERGLRLRSRTDRITAADDPETSLAAAAARRRERAPRQQAAHRRPGRRPAQLR